jgi:8-oxo-dGTP pyrophosphatase MutT (NUDIX family)
MMREVQEETGVVPLAFREWGRFAVPGGGTLMLYVVTEWRGGEPRLCGVEHSELRWFASQEAAALPGLVAPERATVIRMRGAGSLSSGRAKPD